MQPTRTRASASYDLQPHFLFTPSSHTTYPHRGVSRLCRQQPCPCCPSKSTGGLRNLLQARHPLPEDCCPLSAAWTPQRCRMSLRHRTPPPRLPFPGARYCWDASTSPCPPARCCSHMGQPTRREKLRGQPHCAPLPPRLLIRGASLPLLWVWQEAVVAIGLRRNARIPFRGWLQSRRQSGPRTCPRVPSR